MTGNFSGYRIAGLALAGCLWVTAAQAQEPAANDGTNATYWMQNAVEYKATTQALYELAKLRLNQALGDPSWTAALEQGANYEKKPAAVILDVDETVLDNSEYQAWIVENGEHYSSKTWAPFVNTETSRPIPGSLDFIKYAAARELGPRLDHAPQSQLRLLGRRLLRLRLGRPRHGKAPDEVRHHGRLAPGDVAARRAALPFFGEQRRSWRHGARASSRAESGNRLKAAIRGC